ncbi:sulfatase atsG, partial [bacterium]|nr:sulfatase atsG [bacterium]
CQTNLFGQPEFSTVQQQLATKLEQWMAEQGDSGRPVELEALDRQADWRKARNKPKPAKANDVQK